MLLQVLLSDRSECVGKERYAGYFEIKMLSTESVRAVLVDELELTP
jgi:hypothetical protein